jgi:uncharacterized membrane protein
MTKFDISKYTDCKSVVEYFSSYASFEEAWQDCKRGDWMLWIAELLGVDDRTRTLAKALCVNIARSLITDERTTAAIDAAQRYAAGEISREELNEYERAAGDAVNALRKAYGEAPKDSALQDTLGDSWNVAAAAYRAVGKPTTTYYDGDWDVRVDDYSHTVGAAILALADAAMTAYKRPEYARVLALNAKNAKYTKMRDRMRAYESVGIEAGKIYDIEAAKRTREAREILRETLASDVLKKIKNDEQYGNCS